MSWQRYSGAMPRPVKQWLAEISLGHSILTGSFSFLWAFKTYCKKTWAYTPKKLLVKNPEWPGNDIKGKEQGGFFSSFLIFLYFFHLFFSVLGSFSILSYIWGGQQNLHIGSTAIYTVPTPSVATIGLISQLSPAALLKGSKMVNKWISEMASVTRIGSGSYEELSPMDKGVVI